jgi:hypothetical protein
VILIKLAVALSDSSWAHPDHYLRKSFHRTKSVETPPQYPWSERHLNLLPRTLLSNKATPSKPSPSPSPFPRYGHALPATSTAAGELVLFGGLVHESVQNDLYIISTRDLAATSLQTSGDIPSPRVGHAAALISNYLLIWGGDTNPDAQDEGQDDSLYLLNLGVSLDGQTLSWLISVPYTFSIARVGSGSSLWFKARRSLWPYRHNGRFQVLRFRWTG